MLHYAHGNLLDAPADALVNTVNEVGVMGKGIALMFKEGYPEASAEYEREAKAGRVKVGPVLARALIAELVRRYAVLGLECTNLEVQKLAWLLVRSLRSLGLEDPLKLKFIAHRYGPYADRLRHLLNSLDGSYLHSQSASAMPGRLT